jgi:phosphatidylethanolamine/phosphatidyl-N-methylethanolamine N-methyltransferase
MKPTGPRADVWSKSPRAAREAPAPARRPRISERAVVEAYRRFAPVYDATFGRIVGRYHRHIGDTVRQTGAVDVLEVGVGTGLSLGHYPRGTRVVGVDLSEAMLARARERVGRGVEATVDLRLADGERLGFADGAFDLVVLPFVVSVTPDPQALLDEVARVLRPGGTVLVLNHFSGVSGLRWIERLLAPLADRIGFRSDFPLEQLRHPRLEQRAVRALWPIGFFQMVRFEKSD